MATRKVYIEAKLKMCLVLDEGMDVDEVIGGICMYEPESLQDDIPDFEIYDVNIVDSK